MLNPLKRILQRIRTETSFADKLQLIGVLLTTAVVVVTIFTLFFVRGYLKQLTHSQKAREAPRTIHMPGFQEVLRCALCGAIVPPPVEINYESQCPKCKADLRSCKNCRHFDTGAQFECTQPIPERITKKDIRNRCEFFMARTSVERETRDSGGGSKGSPTAKPADARSAFDNLFKK